jgi:hypothetical protein
MAEPKSDLMICPLGGGIGNIFAINFAFRCRKDAYKNIADDLGIAKAQDTDNGLVFGMNNPRPVTVRINYVDGAGVPKSTNRFCQPDSVSNVTTGGSLNNKKVVVNGQEYSITSVTIKSN